MGIIIIKKLIEVNNIGYFIIEAKDYGCPDIYMSENKNNKVISFYESSNCGASVMTIDYNDDCKESGALPGIDSIVLYKSAYRASKMFDQIGFPDLERWTSCGR
jgi:MoaA/NifB/PqqE/SkfB family radical SAM enzyme